MSQDLINAATAFHASGLSLMPVEAATKKPVASLLPRFCPWPKDDRLDNESGKPTWTTFQGVRADMPLILYWIKKGAQIAVVCGAISGGLLIIDIDGPGFYLPLLQAIGPISAGLPIQQTGGGGYQIAMRCDDPGHNNKLAYVPDVTKFDGRSIAIETRGEGGYAIVYPSLHPSGNRYQRLQGDFAKIPYLPQEQIDKIRLACKSLCKAPLTTTQIKALHQAMQSPAPTRQSANGQANVIDAYNASTTIEQELTRQGYTHCYGDRWCPPGAPKSRDSVLVTNGRAYHFDSDYPLCDGFAHDAFDLFKYYEHQDDSKQAIKTAAALLCLPPITPSPAPAPQLGATVPPVNIKIIPAMPDAALIKDCLFKDEVGDAHLFHALYNGRLAFDHSTDQWFLWAGNAWERDGTGLVTHLIGAHIGATYLTLMNQVNAQAMAEPDQDKKDALLKTAGALFGRIKALYKLKRLNSIATLCQHLFGISGNEWDAQPYLLAVKNGVLDLRTGNLAPGTPGQYLRKVAPTDWQGLQTPAPRWEQFLTELFEPGSELADIPAYLQRLFGYGLLGLVREHVLPVLHGLGGRNGKDTMLKTIQAVLGSGHADAMSNDVLVATGRPRDAGAPSAHLMDLQGKRLVWASEPEDGARFSVGQAKLLSGGGAINARPPHGKYNVTWQPSHLMLLLTNHKPKASAEDDAFWYRMQLIPFLLRFLTPENMTGASNERPADTSLNEKLKSEASGILAWMVRGCLDYQRIGILPPDVVRVATAQYRSDEDTFGDFLEDCMYIDPTMTAGAQETFKRYQDWALDNGIRYPMDNRKFSKRMKERFTSTRRGRGFIYHGVGIAL